MDRQASLCRENVTSACSTSTGRKGKSTASTRFQSVVEVSSAATIPPRGPLPGNASGRMVPANGKSSRLAQIETVAQTRWSRAIECCSRVWLFPSAVALGGHGSRALSRPSRELRPPARTNPEISVGAPILVTPESLTGDAPGCTTAAHPVSRRSESTIQCRDENWQYRISHWERADYHPAVRSPS